MSLIACAPTHDSYYKPIGPGKIYGVGCSGPRMHMGYEVKDGFGIMVSAWKFDTEKLSSVYIEFYVGQGHTLRILAPNVVITSQNDNIPREYSLGSLKYSEVVDGKISVSPKKNQVLPISSRLEGASLTTGVWFLSKFQTYQSYLSIVDAGGLATKSFFLHFPDVELDGVQVQIPEVQFKYSDEYFVVGLMC